MLIDNSSQLTEGTDITTKEGWEKYIQEELDFAHKRAQEKEIPQWILLLCQVDPQTLETLPEPRPVIMVPVMNCKTDDKADECKELFIHTCRAVALLGRAIACINTSEAWVSVGVGPESVNDPNRPRPKDDPNRKEMLFVLSEHRDFGSDMHSAFITHDNEKRILGEWVSANERGGVQLGGRMTGMVPPLEVYDRPAIKIALELAQQLLGASDVRWSN